MNGSEISDLFKNWKTNGMDAKNIYENISNLRGNMEKGILKKYDVTSITKQEGGKQILSGMDIYTHMKTFSENSRDKAAPKHLPLLHAIQQDKIFQTTLTIYGMIAEG